MTRFNRDYLVPYLQDVCALQLAKRRLDEHKASLSVAYDSIQYQKELCKILPMEPEKEPPGCLVNSLMVLGTLTLLFSFLMKWLDLFFLFIFFIVGGIIELLGALLLSSETTKINDQREKEYKEKVAKHEALVRQTNDDIKNFLPGVTAALEACKKDLENVNTTLAKVYSVNIIPRTYRNVYAAMYLCDWFSSGQSSDLDMALNTFVLEEIKERLDTVIKNQEATILNHRIMIANQERNIELQIELSQKLHRLQLSADETNLYLGMIESNTATTSFFASADFLQRSMKH